MVTGRRILGAFIVCSAWLIGVGALHAGVVYRDPESEASAVFERWVDGQLLFFTPGPMWRLCYRCAPGSSILSAMLAMGMAGEPETEVYTRAGVLFWLFHYAAMHLAVLVGPRHQTPQTAWSWGSTPAVVSRLSLVALTLGVVGLIWLDREATHLVVFIGLAGAGASGLSLAWLGWRRCG